MRLTVSLPLCLTAAAFHFGLAGAVGTKVDLGYAIYEGFVEPNGVVTRWLGMRFAAPPLGNLRFRAPQDPSVNRSVVQMATQNGPLCLGVGQGFPVQGADEDCLFIAVNAPTHATPNSKLPVFFWIDSGGFAGLGDANLDGDDLIKAAQMDLVVVTFNYRLGLHGFLASEEVRKNGDLNAGLFDQRKALEWVHEHIDKFGGDPNHVTLGGASASGTSIALFLTAFSAAPTNLFHAAIAESRASLPMLTVPESEFQSKNLSIVAGCQNARDTLACLRGVSPAVLQKANVGLTYPNRIGPGGAPPLFTWLPVIDGSLVVENVITMFEQGRFVKVPTVFGDDTNEGTLFVPFTTNSTAQMGTFLKNNYAGLTDTETNQIIATFPKSAQFPGKGEFFSALGSAYGELAYICPGILFSAHINQINAPTWNYRYNVLDPDEVAQGVGVPHIAESNAVWGPENTGLAPASYFTTNAPIIPVVQGYWTSFIRSFNPNTHRAPGSPVWEPFGSQMARLKIQTNATQMEVVPLDERQRCEFLNGISVQIQGVPL